MKRMHSIKVILLLSLIAFACERHTMDDIRVTVTPLPAFDTLRIDGPLNVCLVSGSGNQLTVSGESPVVDRVRYRIDSGTLLLTSEYPYKMFRPASNKADITLSAPSLSRIVIEESCGLKTDGRFIAGELGLVVTSKFADVDLELDCTTFYYWDYSLSGGMVHLSGRAGTLKIWNYALMTVDAGELEARNVLCENTARSPCYINASGELRYSIYGQGDIFYFGTPDTIVTGEVTSTGRLLKAD